jgi:hypothetical protein
VNGVCHESCNIFRGVYSLHNPVVLSLHSQAARKHADLRPMFPVLNVKLKQIKIRQRELKVYGKASLKVNLSDLLI